MAHAEQKRSIEQAIETLIVGWIVMSVESGVCIGLGGGERTKRGGGMPREIMDHAC